MEDEDDDWDESTGYCIRPDDGPPTPGSTTDMRPLGDVPSPHLGVDMSSLVAETLLHPSSTCPPTTSFPQVHMPSLSLLSSVPDISAVDPKPSPFSASSSEGPGCTPTSSESGITVHKNHEPANVCSSWIPLLTGDHDIPVASFPISATSGIAMHKDHALTDACS